VWVGSDVCNNCANPNKFDFANSTTFKQLTPYISNLSYGMGSVWGFDTTDQVCLNEDSVIGNGCMADYLFKTVVEQKDLSGLAGAGLIGLSPSNQYSGAQLFVPSLYEQGAIKKNMFSMFIDQTDVSMMQIGGYNLDKYAKGPLNWVDLTS